MARPNKSVKKLKDKILREIVVHLDLLNDNCFFLADIDGSDFRVKDHVRQDIKGLVDMFSGNLRIKTCLFFGSKCVERAPNPLDPSLDLFTGIFFASLEHDMFQKMRNAFV